MEVLNNAERDIFSRQEEAESLMENHEKQRKFLSEKIKEYENKLFEIRQAKEVLKENGLG